MTNVAFPAMSRLSVIMVLTQSSRVLPLHESLGDPVRPDSVSSLTLGRVKAALCMLPHAKMF